jgi:uncharacterized protein
MDRELFTQLKLWQKKTSHLPILLRGARQVGKTYLIEQFGKSCFENMVSINFEESPEYIDCFATLKPTDIINKIEAISRQPIIPGKTLLFFDEIQACPNAIMALRYFKEKQSALHVIGAGSLLEFALSDKNMKMPVGRIQYLYLKPLSFREYLKIIGADKLLEIISNATVNDAIPDAIHHQALQLVQEYMTLGGMPMVVDSFIRNHSMRECQHYQTLLLKTYRDDFAKYAKSTDLKYLQQVYERAPGLVGQHIKYVNISPDMDPRYLKNAIYYLNKAGVIFSIHATTAAGLPLITHVNEKKFKVLFLDIGLLKRATKLDIDLLLQHDLMLLNRGAMSEQFVGQELLAYQDPYDEPHLYYWMRDKKSSMAEVDYLINVNASIIPIEVKAGKTGTLKSLHLLMQEKNLPLGVRISEKQLSQHENILSIPLYMIDQLPRLLAAYT